MQIARCLQDIVYFCPLPESSKLLCVLQETRINLKFQKAVVSFSLLKVISLFEICILILYKNSEVLANIQCEN